MAEAVSEEDQQAPEKPKRSWLRFWLQCVFWLIVFMGVMLLTLSLIGGKSEALHAGVEQFFSRASGHPARVGVLNGLYFFPNFQLDAEHIEILEPGLGEVPVATLDRLKAAMGFWDMFFRTGNLKAFDLEGLRTAPGFLHPKALEIERIALHHPAGETPYVRGEGRVGETPWHAQISLQAKGRPSAPYYSFAERRNLELVLGPLSLSAVLSEEGRVFKIEELALRKGGAALFSGALTIDFSEPKTPLLRGTLSSPQGFSAEPHMHLEWKDTSLALSGEMLTSPSDIPPATVSGAFETWRADVQRFSGYPDKMGDQPALLTLPLILDVQVKAKE